MKQRNRLLKSWNDRSTVHVIVSLRISIESKWTFIFFLSRLFLFSFV